MLFFIDVLSPRKVYAEASLSAQFEYQNGNSETVNKVTGTKTSSDFSRFAQSYNMNLSRRLFPQFEIRGGGTFSEEAFESDTMGVHQKADERRIRPFVGFEFANPLYVAGATYNRTDLKSSGENIPTTRTFRDEYIARFSWMPVDFPRVSLTYSHSNVYDEPETRDSVDDQISLTTRYDWDKFKINYSYTHAKREELKTDVNNVSQAHSGRISYSDKYFENRVSVSGSYNIDYSSIEILGTGGGTVPLFRSGGLFSVSDNPAHGPALTRNNSLIDGNFTVSSGVDIGLAGDRARFTNVGLDLGTPVTVDTIFLWVDRRLPPTVASSFSWEIYTSRENTDASTWTLHATVFPAVFGDLNNRFEIRFPPVETAFIKVVTRPLSPTVPGASDFSNIFFTEMEAFATIAGRKGERTTAANQMYRLGLGWVINSKTSMGYDLSYRVSGTDLSFNGNSNLVNSLNLNHIFNRVFSSSAFLQRADEKNITDETAYNWGGGVNAIYLPTFRQSLSYSGSRTSELTGTTTTHSIFLTNYADLYPGWNVFLNGGYSWSDSSTKGRSTGMTTNAGTSVIPNKKITLTVSASSQWTWDTENGVESSRHTYGGDAGVSLLPFRNLSLSGTVNYFHDVESSRTLQNYIAAWSPFPGGALQLFVRYNESLSSANDSRQRIIGPGLRLDLIRHSSLIFSYDIIKTESSTEVTDQQSLDAKFSLTF